MRIDRNAISRTRAQAEGNIPLVYEGMATPWGPAQIAEEIRPGIGRVSTAGHGGILLSAERRAALPFAFVGFATGNNDWYEEDEDVTAVYLAFAPEFDDYTTALAVRYLELAAKYSPDRWRPVQKWLDTSEAGFLVKNRAAKWEDANDELWMPVSMCSGDGRGDWHVNFRRVDGKAEQNIHLATYPPTGKPTLTTEELAALPRAAKVEKVNPPTDDLILTIGSLIAEPRPEFREECVGGVFDGNRVMSDADLGL